MILSTDAMAADLRAAGWHQLLTLVWESPDRVAYFSTRRAWEVMRDEAAN